MCVCVCARTGVHACVRARTRMFMRVYVYACVRVHASATSIALVLEHTLFSRILCKLTVDRYRAEIYSQTSISLYI